MKISILTYGSRGDVQPFLALGVGPRPIPIGKLNQERLSVALDEMKNPAMVNAARQLGQAIRAERGWMWRLI